MTIVCSWCRVEGQRGIVGEKAPLEDRRETHGICPTHRIAVQKGWTRTPTADTQQDQWSGDSNVSSGRWANLWTGLTNFGRKTLV